MSQSITSFFDAWGDPDGESRAKTLAACLADSVTYSDPRTPDPLTDRDALIEYVGLYNQFAPGATARVAALATINDCHRTTVSFEMPDGKQQLGQYFIELDPTGRLSRITGFVGLGEPA